MYVNIYIPTLDELIQVVRSQNSEEELMMIGEIMQIFRSRNLTAQRQLLEQCPAFSAKAQLLKAMDLNNQAAHINTLGILAMAYSWTPPPELSVIFGKTGYFLANDYLRESEPDLTSGIWLTSLTQSVLGCSTALYALGRYEELLEFSEPAFSWIEQNSSSLESRIDQQSKGMVQDNLNSLRLHLIEANIKLQRYDNAAKLVKSQKAYITQLSEPDQFRFKRLKALLKKLLVSPAVFSLETSETSENEFRVVSLQLDMLAKLMSAYIRQASHEKDRIDPIISEIPKIRVLIEQLDLTSSESSGIAANEIANRIAELKARLGTLSEVEQVQQKIRTASIIFLDPNKGHDPVLIKQSLSTLQEVLQWTHKHHYLDEECDALWGMSICYRRQEKIEPDANLKSGYTEKSVEILQSLRKNIELIRSRITDPYKRVYWLNRYEYLFPILCWQLYKLDRPLELLDAIEGAKGRVLADVLTRKEEQPVPDFDFSASVQQLPTLMQQVEAHYLTYLVDDEETFAVLVTKDGSLHTHSIPIGKTHLKGWLSYNHKNHNPLDPKNWGNKIDFKKNVKVANLSELLAPLVSWLEPYVKDGLIQKNDHICYSPDASLHLIPLHYLPFLGEPLVRFLSVSRIHGAAALIEILKQPSEKPSRFTAVYVPAETDFNNPKNPRQAEDIRWIAYWLQESKKMIGHITALKEADLATVTQLPFSQRLVHFSTHGIFPSEHEQSKNKNVNPYHNSGLVLAKNNHLPKNPDGKKGTFLTPKVIIEGKPKLNFSGSHVTMQACVTGQAKEGIGGDAIGLDWALMLAKASSLLSTHWDVDISGAKLFSHTFYEYWLFENHNSRAQAWRKTVLDLIENQETSSPYYWAAFSLSGDWR